MSLLFNMLSRLVITFLPRSKHLLIPWLRSPSAVILEPRKIKSATVSTVSASICHEVMGPDALILVFWMLSFKLEDNKCNKIKVMCLNHAEPIPYSKSMEKQSSVKPIPDVKNVGDWCFREQIYYCQPFAVTKLPKSIFECNLLIRAWGSCDEKITASHTRALRQGVSVVKKCISNSEHTFLPTEVRSWRFSPLLLNSSRNFSENLPPF